MSWRSLALQNKAVIYNLLFRATAETLLEAAASWKDLKAKLGFFAILHTWGQKLDLHPHLHCVVPGGGISQDGTRWVPCPRGYSDASQAAQPNVSRQVSGTDQSGIMRRGELTL